MANARFRLGTAATNSAGTVWSWRAYDTAADIVSGSYVKVDLENTSGVRTLSVSIPSADPETLSAGVPTVTTVQASKTATFRAGTGGARTYLVRAVINDGRDLNNDIVSAYTKSLAVHIKTQDGYRLIAVGETDEADRTSGYTPKLNASIRGNGAGVAPLIAAQHVVAGVAATPGWEVLGAFTYTGAPCKLTAMALVATTALTATLRLYGPMGGTPAAISGSTCSTALKTETVVTSDEVTSGLTAGSIYQVQMEVTGGAASTDLGVCRWATLVSP